MIIKNIKNLTFAVLILASLTACANNEPTDNNAEQAQTELSENKDTEPTSSVAGDIVTEDGTYIASFDTGGTGDEKYRDYDLKIQDSTLIIEGILEYTSSEDKDIKTLENQTNAFAIDQNTQFQVQDTYNQQDHSQEEFLEIFEDTKGKQNAIFIEVFNGKVIVINLGIRS